MLILRCASKGMAIISPIVIGWPVAETDGSPDWVIAYKNREEESL